MRYVVRLGGERGQGAYVGRMHRRHGEWFEPHPNLLNFIHSQGDGDG